MGENISLSGRTILLVEDEMMVFMLIERALEKAGGIVVSAGNLDEATDLAKKCKVDAAVLDVNLHGKRSYPVADILVSRGIPFVFSTGYGDAELSILYPDNPVLPKPFRTADLVSVLLSVLAE